jgi:hypothetical protein
MGNTASAPNSSTQDSHTESNITTLPYLIDEIAMHYMLTQNSIELIRISDKEYYDNLIILTSNVIEKRLNNLEIGYLKNRITGNSDQIQDILPANSKMKDKVVMDISKFYIKIVMIYSAIASTFDPQYSYSDESGVKSFYLKDFEEYKNIPKNVKPELVQLTNPLSLCRKRLNILKNRYDDTSEPGSVILNPGEKLCSTESSVKLTDEIGIKELDSLYYDLFDYNTKTWSKRSNRMKKKYNKDLILFYRIFTGKKNKPSTIKSFQDIELLDFKTLNSCSENTFLSDIIISKENKLVKQYKEKIDLIQSSTEDNRNQLYSILKELFIIKVVDNEQSYTINPSLTLDKILLLEEQTRNIILDLYISCEKYFIQALIIFENIYESKDYTISELRKENLMKIQETPTPNYKDTLIIPPFSPDMKTSESPIPESFTDQSTPIEPENPETLENPLFPNPTPETFPNPNPETFPNPNTNPETFQTHENINPNPATPNPETFQTPEPPNPETIQNPEPPNPETPNPETFQTPENVIPTPELSNPNPPTPETVQTPKNINPNFQNPSNPETFQTQTPEKQLNQNPDFESPVNFKNGDTSSKVAPEVVPSTPMTSSESQFKETDEMKPEPPSFPTNAIQSNPVSTNISPKNLTQNQSQVQNPDQGQVQNQPGVSQNAKSLTNTKSFPEKSNAIGELQNKQNSSQSPITPELSTNKPEQPRFNTK